ncbi:hypothetical protein Q3A66_07675 [Hymenobacter sp. BT770]|uniref:hypothetical protein n=1 Tax=Hymenobacter sp. BT770 TaxID=2886942 RepID=UPI001D130056|nr:hypothetical protein [Hymenobacter sp. BT770]MCC3152870.1 hypothetical protein [Hymenobacter sp. BT770]MDO3414945.1 hypothetical protein [Hymenobacter sp. BT770]
MTSLPQIALTLLGLLFCVGDVAALGLVLTWQERAPTPAARRQRLVRGVLPATVVLLGLLLLAFTQLMLLWSRQ